MSGQSGLYGRYAPRVQGKAAAGAKGSLAPRELVLVGGGHAHVQVLRSWAMAPMPGVRLSLVVDSTTAVYSGMLPGYVAGDYSREEISIDLARLAGRAGACLLHAAATRVDAGARLIELSGRAPIRYDVASLDIGSVTMGQETPGVLEHALSTRPIGTLAARIHARLRGLGAAPRVCIVGGGAAGVELAFCCQAWLRRGGGAPRVSLLESGVEVLGGHPESLRQRVFERAAERGLRLLPGSRVVRVTANTVELDQAEPVECDLVLWAAGAAAPPLVRHSGLAQDSRGFALCGPGLEVVGARGLFAVGDCAVQHGNEWVPRAGVYAVRQGPVLTRNLRAALAGEPLEAYTPQRDYLSLLNLGNREALGSKWGRSIEGGWVWHLKDRIDRRFVQRFNLPEADVELDGSEALPFAAALSAVIPREMDCGGCAAKLEAGALSAALGRLPEPSPGEAGRPEVLLGLAEADDVAAWKTKSGELLLATVDAFTAFTEDYFTLGQVAAVHALSDIWAKAGQPQLAMCTLGVPDGAASSQAELVFQLLSGARTVLDRHGIALVGGHTQRTQQLSVGFAVWGAAGPALLSKRGALPGDALILTKPLGTAVLLYADSLGQCRAEWRDALYSSLLRENQRAGQLAAEHAAHACTDVTGFGLAGHLAELLGESGARVQLGALPALPGALDLLARGYRSSFHGQNAQLRRGQSLEGRALGSPRLQLAFDPQTSGGLLIAVPAANAGGLLSALRGAGDTQAAKIGEVVGGSLCFQL